MLKLNEIILFCEKLMTTATLLGYVYIPRFFMAKIIRPELIFSMYEVVGIVIIHNT